MRTSREGRKERKTLAGEGTGYIRGEEEGESNTKSSSDVKSAVMILLVLRSQVGLSPVNFGAQLSWRRIIISTRKYGQLHARSMGLFLRRQMGKGTFFGESWDEARPMTRRSKGLIKDYPEYTKRRYGYWPISGYFGRGPYLARDLIGVQLIWFQGAGLNHRRSLSRLPIFFALSWKLRDADIESSGYLLNDLNDAAGMGEEGYGGAARYDTLVQTLGTKGLGSASRGGAERICGRCWRRETSQMYLDSVCSADGEDSEDAQGVIVNG